MKRYVTFLILSLLGGTAMLKAGPFDLATADLETRQSKSVKLKAKLTTIKSRELRQNIEERIGLIERSIGGTLSIEDLFKFNTLQQQKKAHLESLRLDEETRVPQGFKIKEDLIGNIQWSFGAPGATLTSTLDGKKLVTNTTKSMQLTKNFTTEKTQKVQIPFSIVVTKGEVKVSLHEFGKLVPLQSKTLRAGDTPNGVLEFDAPGPQMLTVVISNEINEQTSECTLKDLRILLEEEPRVPQNFNLIKKIQPTLKNDKMDEQVPPGDRRSALKTAIKAKVSKDSSNAFYVYYGDIGLEKQEVRLTETIKTQKKQINNAMAAAVKDLEHIWNENGERVCKKITSQDPEEISEWNETIADQKSDDIDNMTITKKNELGKEIVTLYVPVDTINNHETIKNIVRLVETRNAHKETLKKVRALIQQNQEENIRVQQKRKEDIMREKTRLEELIKSTTETLKNKIDTMNVERTRQYKNLIDISTYTKTPYGENDTLKTVQMYLEEKEKSIKQLGITYEREKSIEWMGKDYLILDLASTQRGAALLQLRLLELNDSK